MHQVRHAGNRSGRERERFEQARLGVRRGRHLLVGRRVDVVRKTYGDAALRSSVQRAAHDLREGVRQPDVVDRDLEGLLGGGDEVGERLCRALGRLAAVYERERLYSRFHDWYSSSFAAESTSPSVGWSGA